MGIDDAIELSLVAFWANSVAIRKQYFRGLGKGLG